MYFKKYSAQSRCARQAAMVPSFFLSSKVIVEKQNNTNIQVKILIIYIN